MIQPTRELTERRPTGLLDIHFFFGCRIEYRYISVKSWFGGLELAVLEYHALICGPGGEDNCWVLFCGDSLPEVQAKATFWIAEQA